MHLTTNKVITIIISFLGIASLLFLIGYCLYFPLNQVNVNGYQAIFGYSLTGNEQGGSFLSFSVFGFMSLLFIVLGTIISALNRLRFSNFISAIFLITGGVLLLCLPNLLAYNIENPLVVFTNREVVRLANLYISGILAIITGLLALVKKMIIDIFKK